MEDPVGFPSSSKGMELQPLIDNLPAGPVNTKDISEMPFGCRRFGIPVITWMTARTAWLPVWGDVTGVGTLTATTTVIAAAAKSRTERRVCFMLTLLVILIIILAQLLLAANYNESADLAQVYVHILLGPLNIPNVPTDVPAMQQATVVPKPSPCASLGEMRAVNSFGLLGAQRGERHPVLMFKNVPYAEPVERFQPALPWASPPWEGIRDATRSGPPCFQLNWDRSNGNNYRTYRGVEDCLTMDVVVPTYAYNAAVASQTEACDTTPSDADSRPIPIIVVIHDGNLEEGDIDDPDGLNNNMAITLNSVVISVNYRLGALGFLPVGPNGGAAAAPAGTNGTAADTPAAAPAARRLQQAPAAAPAGTNGTAAPAAPASATSPAAGGTGGLNGINDIIVALQMIQNTAHEFGGDPERVTIHGVGSSSEVVCILGASPLAAGLFSAVTMSGGACGGPKGVNTQANGELVRQAYMDSLRDLLEPDATLGEEMELTVDTLREIPTSDLWKLANAWSDIRTKDPLAPTTIAPMYWDAMLAFIDGAVLTQMPMEAYAAGNGNMARVVVGVNSVDSQLPLYATVSLGKMDIPVQPGYSDEIGIPSQRKYYNRRLTSWIKATFAAFPDIDNVAIRAAVDHLYPPNEVYDFFGYESAALRILTLDTDALVLCPAMQTAMEMSSTMEVFTYVFAAGPYANDPLLDMDIGSARGGSRGLAGRGSDVRALTNTLCGIEAMVSICDDIATQNQATQLFMQLQAYYELLQQDGGPQSAANGTADVLLLPDAVRPQFDWQPANSGATTLEDLNTVQFDLPQIQAMKNFSAVTERNSVSLVDRCAFWNQVYASMSFSTHDLATLTGGDTDVDTLGSDEPDEEAVDAGDAAEEDLTDAREAPAPAAH